MNVMNVPVKEITPYSGNAKVHDKTQIENVAKSIEKYGFVQPLVIDKDGVIIIGHCRFSAAKKLKMKEVPCVRAEELTEDQVKALRLIDNKSNESEWDYGLLAEQIPELDLSEFDFDWGIDLDALDDGEVEEDEPPEPNLEEDAISKHGDIWVLGRHRLMCGDSTSMTDVERLMGGHLADLLVTDPPYNVEYEGKTEDHLHIMNDSMSDSNFREFLVDAFASAKAAMKPGAAFYIWHADSEGYNFRGACFDIGWEVKQCLIWVKNSMVLGRQDYQWKHEPCLYGWNSGAGHAWYSDRKQTTCINYDRPTKSKEHPTMKPVGLFDYLIKNSSKKGDIVLDLFGGSGTTIIACEQDGRTGFSMEMDPHYCDVIVKRWETLTGQKAELLKEDNENV